MEYQTDTRRFRAEGVRVGRGDTEVAVFRKAKALLHHVEGQVDGVEYRMKLPAPWTGFRYRLLSGKDKLASAKKRMQMYAFDPDRPLTRHHRVEFELDIEGRSFRLVSEDRHGLTYVVLDGERRCGALAQRPFESQREGPWEADLEVTEDWSVPVAAFVAWLAREARDPNDLVNFG